MRTFLLPRELKARLEATAETLPPGDFIRKPQHQALKDTWCAAHFGIGYERHVAPCTIWVNDEQNSDTDYILHIASGCFPFQATLADVPDRRMSNDHKPGPDGRFAMQPYEPDRGEIEGPDWIARAVKNKIAAHYSAAKTLNLLVYANFSAARLNYLTVKERLNQYLGKFASIWVVTNHQICSIASFPALGEIPELRLIYDPQEYAAL